MRRGRESSGEAANQSKHGRVSSRAERMWRFLQAVPLKFKRRKLKKSSKWLKVLLEFDKTGIQMSLKFYQLGIWGF